MDPRVGERLSQVLEALRRMASRDADPWSGRMLTHAYDPGMDEVHKASWEAYRLYRDKTLLDFTVYPSTVEMERELAGFLGKLFHAPEGYSATYTYGGTESIIVAALAAREEWRRRGGTGTGKIIIPATGHPAFAKAAYLLGLKLVRTPVDPETMEADIASMEEAIDNETVMIAVSAVDYPYGSLDPVPEAGELAESRSVWLHVDACLGGMILAFARSHGEAIPDFDFTVGPVKSISVDMHKYGYAPKGSSFTLFREAMLRAPTIFVDTGWPGYPLVNEAILSTRSAAPLAATWAIARLLGVEGYKRMAGMVIEARRRIARGLEGMGYRVLGRPRAGVLTFTSDEADITQVARGLRDRGWIVQLQPGNKVLGFPPSIHLTISPIHLGMVDSFLASVEESTRGSGPPRIGADSGEVLARVMDKVQREGLTSEVREMVNTLLYLLDPETSASLVREAILEIFTPASVDW